MTRRSQPSSPPTILERKNASSVRFVTLTPHYGKTNAKLLYKFSQNEEIRVVLQDTGARRITEVSPHDEVWGIGLNASSLRAASPTSGFVLNLPGQASGDNLPDILASKDDDTDDTAFEVDPITHIRLDKFLPYTSCRIRPITALLKKALRSKSPPPWRTPFAPFSRKSPYGRSSYVRTGMQSLINRDPSAFTATLVLLASEQPLSRNNAMAQYATLSTSVG